MRGTGRVSWLDGKGRKLEGGGIRGGASGRRVWVKKRLGEGEVGGCWKEVWVKGRLEEEKRENWKERGVWWKEGLGLGEGEIGGDN